MTISDLLSYVDELIKELNKNGMCIDNHRIETTPEDIRIYLYTQKINTIGPKKIYSLIHKIIEENKFETSLMNIYIGDNLEEDYFG
jgi:hypothetical protein